jgi:hypothetical protein
MRGLKKGEEGAIDAAEIPVERTEGEKDVAGAGLHMASRMGIYLNGSAVVIDRLSLRVSPSTYWQIERLRDGRTDGPRLVQIDDMDCRRIVILAMRLLTSRS